MGQIFQGLEGICGATVLGCGDIALILDIHGLFRLLTYQSQSRLGVSYQGESQDG
ncbi:hypothetical protein [Dongshaea marina]|uniref:hypothetical protein n=1 Tax=Dongshaea marina TaxID=2047966 RepID=UPI0019009002|nr:hypothetical protein [Dongshaea marina]